MGEAVMWLAEQCDIPEMQEKLTMNAKVRSQPERG